MLKRCDGKPDCKDGWDEMDCQPILFPKTEKGFQNMEAKLKEIEVDNWMKQRKQNTEKKKKRLDVRNQKMEAENQRMAKENTRMKEEIQRISFYDILAHLLG